MPLEGEHAFDESAETIFEIVFDPAVLESCIPGAEAVDQVSDMAYHGRVSRSLASITITMELDVETIEDDRPDRVVCAIEGSDNRTNSTANGEVYVTATGTDSGTVLSYEADIDFTGRLASLGGRLIKRQIKTDLSTFFVSL